MTDKTFAKVSLVSDLHFRGENKSGLGADMDVPSETNPGVGATPMELLLQAIGGCTGIDVALILRKRKLEPEILEVRILGTKRATHPRSYKNIELSYRCKAIGLTLPVFEKTVKLSLDNYCSVSDALKSSAEISWKCEIIEN